MGAKVPGGGGRSNSGGSAPAPAPAGGAGSSGASSSSGSTSSGSAPAGPPCGGADTTPGLALLCADDPGGGPAPAAPGVPAPPPPPDPAVVAREAALRMQLPAPSAGIGPGPEANEWHMVAVGYPIWLWVDGAASQSSTVTQQGITITLNARRTATRFDLGDGTTLSCAAMTRWTPAVAPGRESPTCGHLYQRPPSRGKTYAVQASSDWVVDWSALGQSGSLAVTRPGPSRAIEVGELVSVVRRPR